MHKQFILKWVSKLTTLAKGTSFLQIKPMNSLSQSFNINSKSTAGIIIIGDEILKGQTQDTNSFFLTKNLHSLAVTVDRIAVIRDDLDVIAREVSAFSKKYTFVITTGGVGPTHDDLTFEGVAKAFGETVVPHPDLVEAVRLFFKTDDLKSPAMKLAHIPKSAKLNYGEDKEQGVKSRYPIVSVKNVYMFPGVPHLLTRAFQLLGKQLFLNRDHQFHVKEIYLIKDEISVAPYLNQVVKRHKRVTFGSYPKIFHSYYRVKITLEGDEEDDVQNAESDLRSTIPPEYVIEYEKDPISHAVTKVERILSDKKYSTLHDPLNESLRILHKCFTDYKPEEVCLCFNGGKDCTVSLHLCHMVLQKLHPGSQLQALYIRNVQPFPQVETFIQETEVRYNLNCRTLQGTMPESLATLLEETPQIKAAVMGMRSTDPGAAGLEYFTMTDKDWPQIMRVNPILSWNYTNVWSFLRALSLPYCNLYDRGYTSLGSINDSHPNPCLQMIDERGTVVYRPAHELTDIEEERRGRLSKQKVIPSSAL